MAPLCSLTECGLVDYKAARRRGEWPDRRLPGAGRKVAEAGAVYAAAVGPCAGEHPDQLTERLWGHLVGRAEPEIQQLLEQAAKQKRGWRLRPLQPNLTPSDGALVRTLSGHSASVYSVAVTPDGHHAISASEDSTLKVWDLEGSLELTTLIGHNGRVASVAVTLNGQRAISASYDRSLKVWDLLTGECLATFIGDSPLTCCAVAPDGVTVVAGDQAGTVHFLRLVEPEPSG
ncbi:MAG: WD40 repeat domain-containing protein [Elainellaceae cyanobacterium]